MTEFEFWSLVLAALALLISALSYRHSVFTQQRQNSADARLRDLQEELAGYQVQEHRGAIEAQMRADIRVSLEAHGKYHRLVLRNEGGATAAHVTFKVIPRPGKHSPLVENDISEKLPIARLEPNRECPLAAALSSGSYPPFEYQVAWEDPDGTHRQHSGTVIDVGA